MPGIGTRPSLEPETMFEGQPRHQPTLSWWAIAFVGAVSTGDGCVFGCGYQR